MLQSSIPICLENINSTWTRAHLLREDQPALSLVWLTLIMVIGSVISYTTIIEPIKSVRSVRSAKWHGIWNQTPAKSVRPFDATQSFELSWCDEFFVPKQCIFAYSYLLDDEKGVFAIGNSTFRWMDKFQMIPWQK